MYACVCAYVCACVHACTYMGLCVCRMAENFWKLVLSLHHMIPRDLTIVIWIGCELISSWSLTFFFPFILPSLPLFPPSWLPSLLSPLLFSYFSLPSGCFSFCVCLIVFWVKSSSFPDWLRTCCVCVTDDDLELHFFLLSLPTFHPAGWLDLNLLSVIN